MRSLTVLLYVAGLFRSAGMKKITRYMTKGSVVMYDFWRRKPTQAMIQLVEEYNEPKSYIADACMWSVKKITGTSLKSNQYAKITIEIKEFKK